MAFTDFRTNFDEIAGNVWNAYSQLPDYEDKIKSDGFEKHIRDFMDEHEEAKNLTQDQKNELYQELQSFAQKRLQEMEN